MSYTSERLKIFKTALEKSPPVALCSYYKKPASWRFSRFCLPLLILLSLLIGTATDLSAGAAFPANEEWQFFRINAQYRGTVKKGFTSLGCGLAWFKDISPDKTQVIMHVSALHPEKRGQKYTFRLNLVLNCQPMGYSIDSEIYAQFTGIEGERQNQIRQLVALLAYMRQVEKTGRVAKEFNSCGALLLLHEVQTRRGKAREINCSWSVRRDFSGKFFFEQLANQMLALDKFRFRSGKLSVSLSKDTAEAINRDFAYRQPFADDVFR